MAISIFRVTIWKLFEGRLVLHGTFYRTKEADSTVAFSRIKAWKVGMSGRREASNRRSGARLAL